VGLESSGPARSGANATVFNTLLPFIEQANSAYSYGEYAPGTGWFGYLYPSDFAPPDAGQTFPASDYYTVVYPPGGDPYGAAGGILVWQKDPKSKTGWGDYVYKQSPASIDITGGSSIQVKLYQCPSDSGPVTGPIKFAVGSRGSSEATLALTNYVANLLALAPNSSLDRTFQDGTSHTILFSERYRSCQGINVAWGYNFFNKGDLQGPAFDTGAPFQVRPSRSACIPGPAQSAHEGGIPVAMADGSVRLLNEGANTAPTTSGLPVFQAMLTPLGGEVVSFD
jgi:prepilin-type processing-associated H-X9-DG protein